MTSKKKRDFDGVKWVPLKFFWHRGVEKIFSSPTVPRANACDAFRVSYSARSKNNVASMDGV